jgi:hypothetical protein
MTGPAIAAELDNVLQRALLLRSGERLEASDLAIERCRRRNRPQARWATLPGPPKPAPFAPHSPRPAVTA